MRWFLVLLLTAAATGQPRNATVSDSRITVNGGETFPLPQVTGDWFATPTDAHVSVRLSGTQARLDMQLDGRGTTQTITAENNSDLGGAHVGFFWHSPGHDVTPRGSDAIRVEVVHLDDREFEARLSGTADGVNLSGTIHLHRDAPPAPKVTGKFGDCDNAIHDKLVMAQNRSPSDCEVKFDRTVRETLDRAFRPVAQYLQQHEWAVTKQSEVHEVTGVPRRSEQAPYRMDFGRDGAFVVEMQLTGAGAAQYQQRMSALTDRIASEIGAGKPGASMQEMQSFAYEMQGAAKFRLSAVINLPGVGITSFSGGHKALTVPGAAFAAAVSHVQASTGGGADNSHDETVILLGNWAAPVIQQQGGGGEHINVKAILNNAAPLSVQNIVIRIQANPANAQQALSRIDFTALDQLLHAPHR